VEADDRTDALRGPAPAGWYPDPWYEASERWFDGTAWTGFVTTPATDAGQHPGARDPGSRRATTWSPAKRISIAVAAILVLLIGATFAVMLVFIVSAVIDCGNGNCL
jgi:hypothetical protein